MCNDASSPNMHLAAALSCQLRTRSACITLLHEGFVGGSCRHAFQVPCAGIQTPDAHGDGAMLAAAHLLTCSAMYTILVTVCHIVTKFFCAQDFWLQTLKAAEGDAILASARLLTCAANCERHPHVLHRTFGSGRPRRRTMRRLRRRTR